jgi:hypothetical protein
MLACLRKKRRASQAAALDVQGVDADKTISMVRAAAPPGD